MARIRIVDAWRRCPTAPLTHQQAIMVMAEAWAEQRVLMRAYAESPDQTRPTIVLHGAQHAIGPAGADPHGPWGIHVEPPADGRAQALRRELELAARRMAGSKGNPPRLLDEEPSFDRRRTNHWAPGTPRALPPAPGQPTSGPAPTYYEPNQPHAAGPPTPAPAPPSSARPTRLARPARPAQPARDDAPPPPGRGSTVFGFARAADAGPGPADPGQVDRAGRADQASQAEQAAPAAGHAPRRRFGSLVGRTMPLGLQLTAQEHAVLDALGEARMLPASRIAAIVGTADGAAWMAAFIAKLGGCGLDLIVATRDGGGEPTYALRG